MKIQADLDRLGCYARSLGMRFQPVKCNIMPFTRKQTDQEDYYSYTLEETVPYNVEKIKYFGITITNDLKRYTYVGNICTKPNRTLGFLRRNLAACPQDVKKSAYKRLVRPVLVYGSSVWDLKAYIFKINLRGCRKRQLDSRLAFTPMKLEV